MLNFQKPDGHNYCESQIGWKGNYHTSGLILRELWLKNIVSPGAK